MAFAIAPVNRVTDYFGLSEDQLENLPTLLSIEGRYHPDPQRIDCHRHVNAAGGEPLVSLKQARRSALKLGASTQPIESWRFETPNIYALVTDATTPPGRYFMPSTFRTHMFPGKSIVRNGFGSEWLTGLTHVRLPFIDQDGFVEYGQWCRGCIKTRDLFMANELPDEVEEQAEKHGLGRVPGNPHLVPRQPPVVEGESSGARHGVLWGVVDL
jgi:hypothetical protein